MTRAIVVGGGVGGLSAAIALAQRGLEVTLCEAKASFGGLASALDADGVRFDGGPYILLDPTGLEHAFAKLGISIEPLGLRRIEDVYEVERADAAPVRFFADLEKTVDGLERDRPGQGLAYRAFVSEMTAIHTALAPLQMGGRPSAWGLVRAGAAWHAPFLLRSFASVLARFDPAVADAIGIWTHVAGQTLAAAPSPLALVPAMMHGPGCFVPARGVAAIPEAVEARAREVGVLLRASSSVRRVVVENGQTRGVELVSGERVEADLVVSDASGVATLLELAPAPTSVRKRVAALPLQSPGVAAYGLADADTNPYLRFWLAPEHPSAPCRLIVRADDRRTRIVAPLAHAVAESLGEKGQNDLLDSVLSEPWVKSRANGFQELARLVPASWGRRHVLHRDSMNPVMTARFMRQGRLPHRVDVPDGLFLVGSSTHPGQWVSFCLISGLLGAEEVANWLSK